MYLSVVCKAPCEAKYLSLTVSRHERYSLVRRRIGTPSVLTYVATFDRTAATVPSVQDLRTRMESLVWQYPSLACRVVDGSTKKPLFEVYRTDDSTISTRIVERSISVDPNQTLAEMVFKECIRWGSEFHPETGNLWRLGRFVKKENGQVAVALCVDHIIGDGKGTLNLFAKLLDNATMQPDNRVDLPPALEDKVNIKPAISTLVKVIIQALVVPKLPRWLVPQFLKARTFWPFDHAESETSSHTCISTLQAEVGVFVSGWTAPQVTKLRSTLVKQTPGITLQAIISASAMTALCIVENTIGKEGTKRIVAMKLTTPTSERNAALGHPDALGNYVGSIDTEACLSSTSNFVDVASSYGQQLRAAVESKSPPTSWGLLDYIDDPDTSGSSQGELTGWETFFLEKATSKEPYSSSIEISNVGLVPQLSHQVQSGIQSFDWMQTPTAIGSAMTINVVGDRPGSDEAQHGHLSFSVTWRRDSVPDGRLSETSVRKFKAVLEALPDLISTQGERGESLTMQGLRQAYIASLPV